MRVRSWGFSAASTALACALVAGGAARPAHAFCGFYVSGADAQLFNNATMVVMMREGTRTVLSMQNNYQGPAEDFAMVVPVPVVLREDNVRTLPREVFTHVDQLAAPRLVEYWEQDPCYVPPPEEEEVMKMAGMGPGGGGSGDGSGLGVTVEAEFVVGEYQIVILSAKDSTGLDTWLRAEGYNIPAGAEPVLRPYVEAGMKFFVAKVDVEKVEMREGMAMLSPLRFHYDTPEFSLPVRLGLLNSAGTQDIIVHILSPGTRYELANYDNVTIPTNIDVADSVRDRFGEFYAALFDSTVEKNPGAVVTEYAWDASTCDPCPTPALTPSELATLGGDVLSASAARGSRGFVLTRLHARYGKDQLGEDLVFREAQPIMGGREVPGKEGLEKGAVPGGYNNFQGRYAIRHRWTGPITCDNPRRGIWGGPPRGQPHEPPRAAVDLAFAKRGSITLASAVREDVPEIALVADRPPEPSAGAAPPAPGAPGEPKSKDKKGCGCDATDDGGGSGLAAMLVALAVLWSARRRRSGDTCG